MPHSFELSFVPSVAFISLVCAAGAQAIACSPCPPASAPKGSEGPTTAVVPGSAATAPAPTASAAPSVAAPPAEVASPSAAPSSPPLTAPGDATAEPATPAAIPNWTLNGNDPRTGELVLRCENAFPPDDHSGKCRCEGYELDVCVAGVRRLTVDRKQCGFICKPTLHSARNVALRCPDRATPVVSAQGCSCSGRMPFDPCAGGLASAKLVARECVVSCKKDQ